MLLTNNYVYPAEVTGYVRAAMADMAINAFTLSQYLPNEFVDDIEYRVAAGGTGLADAAAYRSYDAESPVGRRQTLIDVVGELPPMSLKTRSSEYDRLRMRKVTDQRIRDEIFNDARKLTRDIMARVELARGQTLVQGKTPVPELGTTIDWKRSAAHTVTAATLWNAGSGTPDPLSDLMAWRDTYIATNGVEPGSLVVSRKVWNVMLRNQAVRNQLFPGVQQPSVVTTANLNEMLAAQGLPPVTVYQAQVRVNGVAQPVLDQNTALFLPAPVNSNAEDTGIDEDTQLGGVFWGTTAEALDPRYGIDESDLPGLVAGEFTEEDPAGLWTKVASINLPVLANPNLSFAATVTS
jgi:hypothetical protein